MLSYWVCPPMILAADSVEVVVAAEAAVAAVPAEAAVAGQWDA